MTKNSIFFKDYDDILTFKRFRRLTQEDLDIMGFLKFIATCKTNEGFLRPIVDQTPISEFSEKQEDKNIFIDLIKNREMPIIR